MSHPLRKPSEAGFLRVVGASAIAAALALITVIHGVFTAVIGSESACGQQPSISHAARNDIPADYLRHYHTAGTATGVPWNVLAAIGKTESDHGRSPLPGVRHGANPAGAAGPMQIGIRGRAGNTWGTTPRHRAQASRGTGYAHDGNRDGWANVYDPADAIPAAATYLRDHSAPRELQTALFAYNPSSDYIHTVLTWADQYARQQTQAVATADAACTAPVAFAGLPGGDTVDRVLAYARAQLGKPYQWGAEGPDAFDCSGLTMTAYRAAGIPIPRVARDQWRHGPRIPVGTEQPGDLVFFRMGSDGPQHVGIVLGHGQMIEAPRTGLPVRVRPYHPRNPIGFTRPLAQSNQALTHQET